MSKDTKAWARKARLALLAEYNNQCGRCQSTLHLEWHVVGGEQSHHRMSSDARVSFYRRMGSQGRLQLLCSRCHDDVHMPCIVTHNGPAERNS